MEHPVDRENITLVLLSTVYCSDLSCTGGKEGDKGEKSHHSLSFLLVVPIF